MKQLFNIQTHLKVKKSTQDFIKGLRVEFQVNVGNIHWKKINYFHLCSQQREDHEPFRNVMEFTYAL